MSRFNPAVCSPSKITLCRFIFISGVISISYLLIYKSDLNSTILRARNLLIPVINIRQSNVPTVAVPFIPSTTTTTTTSVTIPEKKPDKVATMNSTLANDSNNNSQNTDLSEQPKEAFVTFSNNNPSYLAVLKVLLDSVHAFSTRPIIAFGIDVDLNIDLKEYPRVIKRRIKQSDCGPSVYFCKIHAILSSKVDYGILMETDDVVNYNVDILFDVLHVWPYPLPISPRHPDDPQNYGHFMQKQNVSKRTTPYIHAHMIWNYRAIPFLENLRSLLQKGEFQGANFDETAVNVMLWKAGANHTLCKYDPYFTYSSAYEKWPAIENCSRYCHTVFITLHGSKDAKESSALFTRLKANAGKPAKQTPGTGGMIHINDTSVTCCYPDSKQSPIHPLLCEHLPV